MIHASRKLTVAGARQRGYLSECVRDEESDVSRDWTGQGLATDSQGEPDRPYAAARKEGMQSLCRGHWMSEMRKDDVELRKERVGGRPPGRRQTPEEELEA